MLDSTLQDTFDRVLRRNPGEPEFHQAVREVFESLEVVQSRHPEYQDHGILMRLCEVMMALPAFYFLLSLAAVIPPGLSPAQTFLLIVALMSFIRWAGFARVVRGIVAGVREREHVQAARALGASLPRILLRRRQRRVGGLIRIKGLHCAQISRGRCQHDVLRR